MLYSYLTICQLTILSLWYFSISMDLYDVVLRINSNWREYAVSIGELIHPCSGFFFVVISIVFCSQFLSDLGHFHLCIHVTCSVFTFTLTFSCHVIICHICRTCHLISVAKAWSLLSYCHSLVVSSISRFHSSSEIVEVE